MQNLAVLTIVQDEPEFIHAWINHYRKHVVQPSDIFVLVHSSAEACSKPAHTPSSYASTFTFLHKLADIPRFWRTVLSAANSSSRSPWDRAQSMLTVHHRVSVLPVHHAFSFDHRWLVGTVEAFYRFLLQSYEWVLFAEIDEFIVPSPNGKYAGSALCELVQGLGVNTPQAVRATGFEIVHQIDEEPPVDPRLYAAGSNVGLSAGALLEDRHLWYQEDYYSKTVLANTPLKWELGFHAVIEAENDIPNLRPSEDLLLVHLHKVDFNLALRRSRRAQARKWSTVDIEQGLGRQNRIIEANDLRAFWQQDVGTALPLHPDRMVPIAKDVKDALG